MVLEAKGAGHALGMKHGLLRHRLVLLRMVLMRLLWLGLLCKARKVGCPASHASLGLLLLGLRKVRLMMVLMRFQGGSMVR